MTCRRTTGAGFTLLEVMIALAIAAGAVAVLVRGMVDDVVATNHMKQTTVAAELARSKLLDVEADLALNGWGEDPEILKDGDFSDEKLPDFRWQEDVVKIQLPTSADLQQAAKQAAQQASNRSGSGAASQPAGGGLLGGLLSGIPGAGMLGAGGAGGLGALGAMGPMGLLLGQFDLFKSALEQSIRKVTVRITWKESGKDQKLALTEYIVDTKAVDQALVAGALAGGASQPANGAQGGAGIAGAPSGASFGSLPRIGGAL